MDSLLFRKTLSAPHSSPPEVRSWAVEDLGRAALASDEDWAEALAKASTCSGGSGSSGGKEWRAALAREWLLRTSLQGEAQIKVPPLLSSVEPFPDDLPNQSLASLAKQKWLAAMFLLDSKAEPASGVLYVSTGVAPLIRLASDTTLPIEGESWKLAWTLAGAALEKLERGTTTLARDLLLNWASTGCVKGNRVEAVELGSKFKAPHLQQRRILVPEANQADLTPYFQTPIAPRIHTCADVPGAIGLVDGTRPLDGDDFTWPEQIEVMHALVGGSYKACLAPIILLRPKRLVLWVSNGPGIPEVANAIKLACQRGLGKALGFDQDPGTEEISSKRLQEAWDQLAAGGLTRDLESKEPVYFNITSGNRLMGMSTLPFIQIHPNLIAVYRDVNVKDTARPFGLTFLRFRGLRALETLIEPPWKSSAPNVINWSKLFDSTVPPKGTITDTKYIFSDLEFSPEISTAPCLEEGKPPS